jgi:hypothetical protein
LRDYPNTAPPRGTDAERQIATVFGVPAATLDDTVRGDLLVERFYAIDSETGEHYVADLLKGRVQRVQETTGDNGLVTYTLLLDLANLQRDKALLAAYVEAVAPPDDPDKGFYLGLRLPVGVTDAFKLNYDGALPPEHQEFRGPNDEDLYAFLVKQSYPDVTISPRLVPVAGYNFLLSNTDLFPYFRTEFRINKGIFLSELLIVDTTSRDQAATFYRLLQTYPRQGAQ